MKIKEFSFRTDAMKKGLVENHKEIMLVNFQP